MSHMELFYGKVTRCDRTDVPEITDTDEYYDWEEEQNGHLYFRQANTLFEVTPLNSIDNTYGGTLLIIPSKTIEFRFLCYWYNGGADKREVISNAIEDLLEHGL